MKRAGIRYNSGKVDRALVDDLSMWLEGMGVETRVFGAVEGVKSEEIEGLDFEDEPALKAQREGGKLRLIESDAGQ